MDYAVLLDITLHLLTQLEAACGQFVPEAGIHPAAFVVVVDWLRMEVGTETMAALSVRADAGLQDFVSCAEGWDGGGRR